LSPSPSLNNPSYLDISIDVNGVAKLMQELDASKASGPNRIPACFLKMFYIELAPIITFVFQYSIYQATTWPLFLRIVNRQTLFQSIKRATVLCAITTDQFP